MASRFGWVLDLALFMNDNLRTLKCVYLLLHNFCGELEDRDP